MKKFFSAAGLALMLLTGCVGGNQWTVKGHVEGGGGKQIIVEASTNGWWYPIDTVAVEADGQFSVSHDAMGYPDIYRLNLDGKMLYFPIDSIETVIVAGQVDNFDKGYALSGSPDAELMTQVDSKIMAVVKSKGESAIATDSNLKRDISNMLLSDPSGIVAYYIINKKVGNTQLFSPQNKADNRVIGAVANAFLEKRPNDPRTEYLKKLYLSNKNYVKDNTVSVNDTVYIEETPIIDLKLSDYKGVYHSLSDLTKQGKVVVLNFTLYGVEQSTAFNIELAKIYDKRKASGLEIYQVAVGGDEFKWKQAAKNLPWITVYNSPVTDAANLLKYNVTSLPTTFIINRRGEIVERVDDVTILDSRLSKYM